MGAESEQPTAAAATAEQAQDLIDVSPEPSHAASSPAGFCSPFSSLRVAVVCSTEMDASSLGLIARRRVASRAGR